MRMVRRVLQLELAAFQLLVFDDRRTAQLGDERGDDFVGRTLLGVGLLDDGRVGAFFADQAREVLLLALSWATVADQALRLFGSDGRMVVRAMVAP